MLQTLLTRSRDRGPDQAGFTLVELLVVILILGILAAISLPILLSQQTKSENAAAKADVRSAVTHITACLTDATPSTAADCGDRAKNRNLGALQLVKSDATTSVSGGAPVFSVAATSKNGAVYRIQRAADGTLTYSSVPSDTRWAEGSSAS